MDNTIYLFDSAKGQKVAFESLQKGKVSLYVCGPTVYDDAHLGHARSAIAFDLLWRLLEHDGYAVRFVKNFTDIDDKILKKSAQTGQSADALTQHYIESYLHDMDALGVRRAHFEPRATQSLEQICAMIARLIESGYAYQTSSGVYFSVAKDSKYGSLSHHYEDEDDTQSRIQNDEEKHDVRDFVLWKSHKEGENVAYDSAFGSGRPGWHIECSAMIEQYFETNDDAFAIDIHAGGSDLFFPHHENEAAQTRCATHKEIAKYWLHNGFVTINEQKMSKSLGNSFFIKDALKLYDGEVLRFYLLGTHYRATLSFSHDDLLASKKRLDRIYRLKKRLQVSQKPLPKPSAAFTAFEADFLHALRDDMNISVALSVVDSFLSSLNETLDKTPKDSAAKDDASRFLQSVQQVLGIGLQEPTQYFQQGVSAEQKAQIESLIEQRNTAKKNKDFATADSIRDALGAQHIALLDTPQGTIWEKI